MRKCWGFSGALLMAIYIAAVNFCRKFSGNFPEFCVESFKGLENDLLRLTVRKRRGLFADRRVLIVKHKLGKQTKDLAKIEISFFARVFQRECK